VLPKKENREKERKEGRGGRGEGEMRVEKKELMIGKESDMNYLILSSVLYRV
jgi:hypothetical protein